MKIILFTWLSPTKDNFNGPSALPYHIMKNRPKDYDLRIYTTNENRVSVSTIQQSAKELDAEIIILKDSLYNYFHKRHTFADIRIKLRIDRSYGQSNYRLSKKYIKEIEAYNPNLVIVLDEGFVNVARQLSHLNLLVFGYDCFPLHYHRLLHDSYCFHKKDLYKEILHKYKVAVYREMEFNNIPCKIAEVGIEDSKYYKIITGRNNAKFYPHPHYCIIDKKIDFNKKKLSIVISGKFDVYTYTDILLLQQVLGQSAENLKERFKFTFLGKTWGECVNQLRLYGFEVKQIDWVDVYADELIKHDIQIFPISVGSGTKGKVLDALGLGLLCIGSAIAFENIYIKNGHSCIQYNSITDLPHLLNVVHDNKETSTLIAENGRQQILKWHNPKRIAKIIFDDSIQTNHTGYDGEKEYHEVVNNLKPLFL